MDGGTASLWLAAGLLWLPACGGRPAMRPALDDTPATMPDLAADPECGPDSARALMRCVEKERIAADLRRIAQPRPPGSEHHGAVRALCAERLRGFGFEVNVERYGSGVNVVGVKPGFTKPKQQVIASAHYDHIEGCAGADDNASGVALVLELARVLSDARFDRTLIVACWDEAESGQLGSQAYAERARERDDDIVAAFAFESVAYASSAPDSQQIPERFEELFPDQALALLDNEYRGDFLTVVADSRTEQWALGLLQHGKAIDLPVQVLTLTESTKARQRKLDRADHSSFWDASYAALLVTDTASFRNPHAHCKDGDDAPDGLDYDFATKAARASLGALVDVLELR
jgi:hypothetical protein